MDDICAMCKNRETCKSPCPPMQWVNGNIQTKEVIVADLSGEAYPYDDYNAVISQIISHNQASDASNIELIRSIKNKRRRAILALRHADIPVSDISLLLRISRRHLHRLIRYIAG